MDMRTQRTLHTVNGNNQYKSTNRLPIHGHYISILFINSSYQLYSYKTIIITYRYSIFISIYYYYYYCLLFASRDHAAVPFVDRTVWSSFSVIYDQNSCKTGYAINNIINANTALWELSSAKY